MLGDAPQTGLVIAEVLAVHVADAVWDADAGMIDPQRLRPLARLGGTLYAELGGVFALERP
jgi:flavin reductase (DIM6/NTAB) family NADH-FMN oxidoreductase RutF